jgi:hypothetical protein
LHLHYVPENETLFSSIVNILLSSCCLAFISLIPHPYFCSKAFTEVGNSLLYLNYVEEFFEYHHGTISLHYILKYKKKSIVETTIEHISLYFHVSGTIISETNLSNIEPTEIWQSKKFFYNTIVILNLG